MFVSLADLACACNRKRSSDFGMGQATTITPVTPPVVPPVPSATLVEEAVDYVVRPTGLPDNQPSTYTLSVLDEISSEAVATGVDPNLVNSLIRQEVYVHRLEMNDPWPAGDLNDLASRLASLAPPVPVPPIYVPVPVYAPAPTQNMNQPFAPQTPAPTAPRRGQGGPRNIGSTTNPMLVAAAAAGVAVAATLLVVVLTRK
jgi:hypothetical protein